MFFAGTFEGTVSFNTFSTPYQAYSCDDGNTDDGDGCDSNCVIEEYYECTLTSQNKSVWSQSCGSGVYDPTSGEQWDDGNIYNNDGWSDNCTIELGYQCDTTVDPSFWTQLWGNGLLDGTETWDDRNDMSLDGWDSNWQTEENYMWAYDSDLGYYACTSDFYSPSVSYESVDTTQKNIVLKFNDTMQIVNITDELMSCSASGANGYTVQWSFTFVSDTQINVGYTVSPELVNFVSLNVIIDFKQTDVFMNTRNVSIESQESIVVSVDDNQVSYSAEASAKSASYTFLIYAGISFGISIITGGSLELMWSLTNTLQIISFLNLLDLYYPKGINLLFKYMKFANFNNQALSLLTKYLFGGNFDANPINTRFEDTGFESYNFVANGSDIIPVILLIILFSPFMILLRWVTKSWDNKVTRYIKNKEVSYNVSSFFRFSIELWLVLFIIWMISFEGYYKSSSNLTTSFGLAIFTMTTMFFIMFYMIVYAIINDKVFQTDLDYLSGTIHLRHKIIFEQFKSNSSRSKVYYPIFMCRRFFLAFVFVYVRKRPNIQIVMLCCSSLTMSFYHIAYRPFKDPIINFLSSVNEILLLSISITLFTFLSKDHPDRVKHGGYVMNALLSLFFLLNYTIISVVKTYEVCRLWRKRSTKRSNRDTGAQIKKIHKGLSKADSQPNQEFDEKRFKTEGTVTRIKKSKVRKRYDFRFDQIVDDNS